MASYDLLITAEEVIASAFPPHAGVNAAAISGETILTAQEKYIKPVLNGLYPLLLEGKYPEFLDGYIKAALAQYVKLLLLPQLAYSVGMAGISTLKNTNLDPCDEKGLRFLCRTARTDAITLMKRAIDHIEENADSFQEYDPDENILKRVNISSQFVL